MNLDKIYQIISEEPRFRKKQINDFIFKKMGAKWSEATNLPKNLIEKLENESSLDIDASIELSNKETVKILLKLDDGLVVEAVLIKNADGRNTVCLSCQVGCPMACAFCATGQMGYERNLEEMEIVEQVLFFARLLKKKGEKIDNIVFMGMGEPFLNFDNVMRAIKFINNDDFIGLGARHISISTVGVEGWVKKITKESLQVNIAISLHAPEDALRESLIKANKAYPLKKILRDVDYYIDRTNRKVMFEYLLIDGVNDLTENAEKLVNITKKPLYMVNLIPCNPVGKFKPSRNIKKFANILKLRGVNAVVRKSLGGSIEAACGQLAIKKSK